MSALRIALGAMVATYAYEMEITPREAREDILLGVVSSVCVLVVAVSSLIVGIMAP